MKYRIKQIDNIFYVQYKKFIFWKNYSEKFCINKKFNSIDSAKDFLLLQIKEDSKKKYRIKEYNYLFYPQKKRIIYLGLLEYRL